MNYEVWMVQVAMNEGFRQRFHAVYICLDGVDFSLLFHHTISSTFSQYDSENVFYLFIYYYWNRALLINNKLSTTFNAEMMPEIRDERRGWQGPCLPQFLKKIKIINLKKIKI
jgi:hypothetical protein